MPALHIRKNDIVQVITGAGSGSKKQGRVLRVLPEKSAVLVEHVRVVKKTVSSKTDQRTRGGIAEQESPIHISNVMLVCPSCGPVKVGNKVEGGKRFRVCKKCGTVLPSRKG